ncbi:hypothetical protein ACI7RC_10155 [Brevibacillus sp. B_LB10_24]
MPHFQGEAFAQKLEKVEQVLNNLKTLDVRLTKAEVQEIDRIFADRK